MTDDELNIPSMSGADLEREPLIAEPMSQVRRFSLRNKRVLFVVSGLVLGAGSALWLTIANSTHRTSAEPKAQATAKVSPKNFSASASADPGTGSTDQACANGQRPLPVKASDGIPISTPDGMLTICPDGTLITLPQRADVQTQTELSSEPSLPTTPTTVSSTASGRRAASVERRATKEAVVEPLLLTSDQPEEGNSAPADETSGSPFLPIAAVLETPQVVRATRLHARDYLLPEGRMIECALSVRLVSELAGKAVCILTRSVYSDTGRVKLLEQGSEVLGEYRALSGLGQTRLMVQWTRIRSPSGIVVRLQADATDPLGATGLEGEVQSHWWTRIGSAFLLSSVQDVIAGAASNSNSGEIVLRSTTATSRTMAEKVLDQNINIPPTFYRQQGDRALIYVNRDVDFQDVYAPRKH